MSKRMWILCAIVFLVCITSVRTMIAPNDADSTPSLELEFKPRWNTYGEYTLRNRRWTYGTFNIPESADKVRLTFDFMPTEGSPDGYLELLLFQDGELLWMSPIDLATFIIEEDEYGEKIYGEIIFNAKIYLGNAVMTVEWFGVGVI